MSCSSVVSRPEESERLVISKDGCQEELLIRKSLVDLQCFLGLEQEERS